MCEATWTLYGLYDSDCPSLHLSPFENKVGGYPDFYQECLLTSAPSCRCCHSPLVLLVQVYCPLEASPYHRLLHIFCCTQSDCWNNSKSWLVLRSQSLDSSYGQPTKKEAVKEISPSKDWSSIDWYDTDWESETESDEICKPDILESDPCFQNLTISPAESEAGTEKACMGDKSQNQYEGPCYPSAYISVVESSSSSMYPQTDKVMQLLEKYNLENPDCKTVSEHSGRSKKQTKEKGKASVPLAEGYEKSLARHGDRMFLKFQKEMAKCPHQILRYCWKGVPALIIGSQLPEETKSCPRCGAKRVFECQLMPPLVYLIQTKLLPSQHKRTGQLLLKPVEFGTAIIYSCSASCWDKHLISESVLFQECIIVQFES